MAAAQLPAVAQLPDFTQAGVLFTRASTEMQQQITLLNNVPPIPVQQIMAQLTQMQQNMAQMQQSIQTISNQLTQLRAEMIHLNTNSMARIQNTYAESPDDPLSPLINISTGAAIANLPVDSAAITHLNGAEIRAILLELGQNVPVNQAGGVALLRKQLRVQMGLRATRKGPAA